MGGGRGEGEISLLYESLRNPVPLSWQVIIHQKVEWLPGSKQQVPNEIELDGWMVEGKVTSFSVQYCLPQETCPLLTEEGYYSR